MLEMFKDPSDDLPYSWPRSVLEKLRPLKISVCPPHRLSECERLYEQNIPHGLPSDHLEEYSKTLRAGKHLVLIVEDGETLVGTFALIRYPVRPIFWLVYVLVNPKHHRRGIGTTIILASLAMLPHASGNEIQVMAITTLPMATSFYERLGFSHLIDEKGTDGQILPVSTLPVLQGVNTRCREWLAQAGVRLDALGSVIPTCELSPPEATAPSRPT